MNGSSLNTLRHENLMIIFHGIKYVSSQITEEIVADRQNALKLKSGDV